MFAIPQVAVLWARTLQSRYFDPAVRAAGLDGVTPHDLRHTAGRDPAVSLCVIAGTDLKTMSTRAGHS